MLKKSSARHCTLNDGSVNAAAVVAKENDGPNLSSGSGSLLPDGTSRPSSSVASDVGGACATVPLTESTEDVSVLAETDLEATESISDLRPLGLPGYSVAPHSVPDRSSSAVSKCIKKPAAMSKSPRTPEKPASVGGKIKFSASLAFSSLSKPICFSHSRFLTVSGRKGARRLRSSASATIRSGDVDSDGALGGLSDCKNFPGEVSL